MSMIFKLNWTDEDFETIEADAVIGSADLDRWPGIPADPEAEARIAREALAGFRAARAAEAADSASTSSPMSTSASKTHGSSWCRAPAGGGCAACCPHS